LALETMQTTKPPSLILAASMVVALSSTFPAWISLISSAAKPEGGGDERPSASQPQAACANCGQQPLQAAQGRRAASTDSQKLAPGRTQALFRRDPSLQVRHRGAQLDAIEREGPALQGFDPAQCSGRGSVRAVFL